MNLDKMQQNKTSVSFYPSSPSKILTLATSIELEPALSRNTLIDQGSDSVSECLEKDKLILPQEEGMKAERKAKYPGSNSSL